MGDIKCGKIYYSSLWIVFLTAIIVSTIRFKEDFHLLILGSVSFLFAFVGRMALKKKWAKWSIIHITGMGLSYIFLLTAVYVDNGKFLPIWKNFSSLVYWLLPSVVGVPIIIRTLLQHPLSSHYFRTKWRILALAGRLTGNKIVLATNCGWKFWTMRFCNYRSMYG